MNDVQERAVLRKRKATKQFRIESGETAQKPLKFATILVPVDYSASSEFAFEYALELAEKFEARVCLLHVVENRTSRDFDAFPLAASRGAARASDKRKLVEFAKSGSHPYITVFPEVRFGEPWEEIVAAARKENADLIVIPTRGLTGLKHVLMGSVAERVVRHAHCPVLALRDSKKDLLVTQKRTEKEE